MAKRALTAKPTTKSQALEVNPGVRAAGTWNVYRSGLETLSINADQLDVTDSGALIFVLGGANDAPPVVVGRTIISIAHGFVETFAIEPSAVFDAC